MAKIKGIIDKLEKIAPTTTQEEWDNSGWQINLGIKTTKKIFLTLNVTEKTVNQAIHNNCDLIISHHPLIFKPLKCIKNKAIIKAIQNNIQIYSAHTNFDKAKNGTTQTLLQAINSQISIGTVKEINEYVKAAKLKTPIKSKEFILKVKKALNINSLKISHPSPIIKTIAICAGAGADFISELENHSIDCFITADIKYHQALESKIMLLDIGHFESEIIALKSLEKIIKTPDVSIIFSKEEPVFETI